MKILIVEDDKHRIRWFKLVIPPSWKKFITDDTQKAKELLEAQEFDYIFLDHDLKEEHYTSHNHLANHAGTGYDIALWLEENKDKQQSAMIVVHSLNPEGVKRMTQALVGRNSHHIPFYDLEKRLKFGD